MNSTVQEFISQKDLEYEKAKDRERNDFYERTGLARKIYMDEEDTQGLSRAEKNAKYPCSGYEQNVYKRYRWEYPTFSDEEYAALKEAQDRVDSVSLTAEVSEQGDGKDKKSGLATFLTILAAVIFLGAFVMSLVLAKKEVLHGSYYTYTKEEFDVGLAFLYWGAGLISGTLMLALAHIVEHLNRQTALLRAILMKKE